MIPGLGRPLLASIVAFSCWGLFPIYWKFFPELPGEDLFMHRLFWSVLTLAVLVPATGRMAPLRAALREPRLLGWLTLSAFLIASNWLMYVVAVTQGHILEASMGYFLNPLINMVVGGLFLKETFRRTQWPAVALACLGVAWIGLSSGLAAFPWIALALSLTFGLYGVIRKLTHVGALEGLGFETAVVFLPFLAWWLNRGGDLQRDLAVLGHGKFLLLSLSGIITCLPLVLFAYAARRLPLQVLGFTQYLSPSLKFLCGWWIFHEPMPAARWQGFILIWLGLAWYTAEGLIRSHRKKNGGPKSPVAVVGET